MTAPSGSYWYAATGPEPSPGSSSSVSVASPPPPITVARRAAVARAGDPSTASFTSPASLTHSASPPSGTSEWGMPGATFTHDGVGSSAATNDQGGAPSSARNARPRAPRRAGTAYAEANGAVSITVA